MDKSSIMLYRLISAFWNSSASALHIYCDFTERKRDRYDFD
ncbi:MAG: hypothetical protein VYE30_05325 [Pseudomonadota bacterium]|nr:hypothetical protein [Pseudomonadota bacterium]